MIPPAVLEIRHGDEVREVTLTDDPVTIGRAADSEIVLNEPLVSRRHARLEWTNGTLSLTDLGSSNGTRLNDASIEPKIARPLKDGDVIEIGGVSIALRLPLTPFDATLVPSSLEQTLVPQDKTLTLAPPAAPRLIVTTTQATREVSLDREVLTLGRDPSNDIVVEDRVVSRRHAQLQRTSGGYEIVDLGGANGLTFGGTRVPKKVLADGDVVWIAQTVSLTYKTSADTVEMPGAPQHLDLRGRTTLTIGRDPQNDVALNHPAISRNHARLTQRGGAVVIEDLDSSNGTFVNGERLVVGQPRPLRPGDTIRVGPVKFIFGPETLQQVDESQDLRLDALHLNQYVGKGFNLLQDISLSIYPREFVAIVGVSGSGKSTLLDALSGFRPASDGTVLVNETDLYRHFDAYRTDLGYVPQDDIIHKELTVFKALDYAARLRLPADTTREERQQRVMEVLATLNLAERKDIPIHRLSGGQRKRVSIGVELLTQPGLFFLDEATSALDPGTESQIMRLLRQLADDGQTVLLVTHATKNVMLCDQVVFLAKGGHLAYFGPPEEALDYFGVQDFDAIYEKLENELTPAAWGEQYRHSVQYQKYVVARLQEKYGVLLQTPQTEKRAAGTARSSTRKGGAHAGVRRVSALRQFAILSARYLDIIRRDRLNLALLFLIAPILGSMDLIAWPRDIFDLTNGDATRTMAMLFLAAIIPFLVGALSSMREIVKEAPIYKRERAVLLKIGPYLGSKVWVGVLFALYHAAALLILKMIAVDFSHLGGQDILKLYITLALAVMSGMMWGLLISALAPREEQAVLLVIVVVVVQMVFSGGILELDQIGRPGEILGDVTSSKWVYQALAAAAQVKTGDCEGTSLSDCHLPGIQSFASDPERRVLLKTVDERYGSVFGADIYKSWAAMGAIMLALLALLFVLQKRKDVV
ncbi:MAG TPA: ABC transporter ATP-binding protein [Chloroflexi bacterium]|nr:ABC transporter ATP-binding protein [Chloroflexota bacterium]